MNHTQLLRAILPDVLIDNFDVAKFEKTALRFDIWLDEKKVQMREDKKNSSVISHVFGEYHTIQDFPIRGRATYLHVRKRKWLDKDTGEIFSYRSVTTVSGSSWSMPRSTCFSPTTSVIT